MMKQQNCSWLLESLVLGNAIFRFKQSLRRITKAAESYLCLKECAYWHVCGKQEVCAQCSNEALIKMLNIEIVGVGFRN